MIRTKKNQIKKGIANKIKKSDRHIVVKKYFNEWMK